MRECRVKSVSRMQIIIKSNLLIHGDPKKPLMIACDASAYAIGAVLSHLMPDWSKKPIMFTSRMLSKAEKNYSQIEKEGLGIIFVVKNFTSLFTEDTLRFKLTIKPLLGLWTENKPIPAMTSIRTQRCFIWIWLYS